MVLFTIIILTYNRHRLVTEAIRSLISQTYRDFEVLLIDNGSTPPVYDTLKDILDERFKLITINENKHQCDIAENALDQMNGTHLLILGDDDALIPEALEILADVIREDDVDMISTGLSYFNHDLTSQDLDMNFYKSFSGDIEEFLGFDLSKYYFCSWGIGPKKQYKAQRMSHSSGGVISKKLIDKTKSFQKELFVKPFGDVGYVGACFHANKIYYLDLPLAVIGTTSVREMNGSKKGQRHKWDREVKHIEYSPLKAPSFINMGTEAHLKVLYRNEINKIYDCELRPDFYYRHLSQVFSDSPWNRNTIHDIFECLPHLIRSIVHYFSLRDACKSTFLLFRRVLNHYTKKSKEVDNIKKQMQFGDINEFAQWVSLNFVKPNLQDRKLSKR